MLHHRNVVSIYTEKEHLFCKILSVPFCMLGKIVTLLINGMVSHHTLPGNWER